MAPRDLPQVHRAIDTYDKPPLFFSIYDQVNRRGKKTDVLFKRSPMFFSQKEIRNYVSFSLLWNAGKNTQTYTLPPDDGDADPVVVDYVCQQQLRRYVFLFVNRVETKLARNSFEIKSSRRRK